MYDAVPESNRFYGTMLILTSVVHTITVLPKRPLSSTSMNTSCFSGDVLLHFSKANGKRKSKFRHVRRIHIFVDKIINIFILCLHYTSYFIQIYKYIFLFLESFFTFMSRRFCNRHSLYAPNVRIPLYYYPHKLHNDQIRQTCNNVNDNSHTLKGTSCLTRVYSLLGFWIWSFGVWWQINYQVYNDLGLLWLSHQTGTSAVKPIKARVKCDYICSVSA